MFMISRAFFVSFSSCCFFFCDRSGKHTTWGFGQSLYTGLQVIQWCEKYSDLLCGRCFVFVFNGRFLYVSSDTQMTLQTPAVIYCVIIPQLLILIGQKALIVFCLLGCTSTTLRRTFHVNREKCWYLAKYDGVKASLRPFKGRSLQCQSVVTKSNSSRRCSSFWNA